MAKGGCLSLVVGILSVRRARVKGIIVAVYNITAKIIAKQEKEVYRNEQVSDNYLFMNYPGFLTEIYLFGNTLCI